MDNPIPIKCEITPSDPDAVLGLKVTLNGQIIQHIDHVEQTVHFDCNIPDSEHEHELIFEMFGKTQAHTEIDADGNIVKDAYLTLSNFTLDEIELAGMDTFEYSHDHNGTGTKTTQKFYGYIGCNGTVTLKFTTPIYLWLLENL